MAELTVDSHKHEPPSEILMRFCFTCGRNDLAQPLKYGHYTAGRKCDGIPSVIVYTRKESQDG